MTETDVAGANELLSQEFDSAILNREGKCVRAGFLVTEAADGKARIYHRLPVSDSDAETFEDRKERDEERHRMVALYMKCFLGAGWYARQRNAWSTHPDLLASRQPW